MRRIIWSLAFLVAAANAQDAPGVLRITSTLVQLDAVVTDTQGDPVTDLTKEDFEILQDGRPMPVTQFSIVAAGPRLGGGPGTERPLSRQQVRRTVAVVVDDYSLNFRNIGRVREALVEFIDRDLRQGDLMALLTLGQHNGAYEQFTTDRALLKSMASRLRFNPATILMEPVGINPGIMIESTSRPGVDEFGGPPLRPLERIGEISINALAGIVQSMRTAPGRKSILLLSTNVLQTPPLQRLIESANRAGISFYTIDPREPNLNGDGGADVDPATAGLFARDSTVDLGLATLSAETGGRSWGAKGRNRIEDRLSLALLDQDTYYLLGYNPGEESFDRKVHRIEIRVQRQGLKVRSRDTFLGELTPPAPEPRDSASILSRLIREPYRSATIRTSLGVFFSADGGDPTLRSVVFIDGRDLQAQRDPNTGNYLGGVELMVAIVDPAGDIAEQAAGGFKFSLTPEEWAQASQTGVAHVVPLKTKKPGPYLVRLSVRDTISGDTGTASSFLEVPDLKKKDLAVSGLLVSAPVSTEASPLASPAARTFHQGDPIAWLAEVYNAKVPKGPRGTDPLPVLNATVRVYREGELVWEIPARPADVRKLSSGKDVSIRGVLDADPRLQPGEYLLQILVQDPNGGRNARPVSQQIDFRIVAWSATGNGQ